LSYCRTLASSAGTSFDRTGSKWLSRFSIFGRPFASSLLAAISCGLGAAGADAAGRLGEATAMEASAG
jgi:hypothetical protein